MPFKERHGDTDDISTSNTTNQVVFSALFVVSSLTLIRKRKQIVRLIRREKFLTIFLAWCLLSLLWSDFGFVAFKRWIQVLTSVTVSLALLLHVDSSDRALPPLKLIFFLYIPLSLYAVLFITGAIDPSTGTWRGLASGKNTLGQYCLVSILLWAPGLVNASLNKKMLSFLFVTMSTILLLGSQSVTSFLTVFFAASLSTLFFVEDRLNLMGVGKLTLTTVIVCFMIFVSCVQIVEPGAYQSVLGFLGKDATFTDRTMLWYQVVEEAKLHPLIGCGFDSFWVIGNVPLMFLYEEFVWLPNQAHMGYLDTWNEIGLIGLFLLLVMVIAYSKNLFKLGRPHIWKWFVFAALVINLQESTLFRLNSITGILFTFSYLALYTDLLHQKDEKA